MKRISALVAPIAVAAITSPVFASDPDWRGFYAGVMVGGEHLNSQHGSFFDGGRATGVIGGRTTYNSLVFGAELDAYISSFHFVGTGESIDAPFGGSFRIIVGFPSGKLLPYVTAGAAVGKMEARGYSASTQRQWHVGFTAGAGIEMPISDQLAFRAGYRLTDLGEQPYEWEIDWATEEIDMGMSVHMIEAGLLAHF